MFASYLLVKIFRNICCTGVLAFYFIWLCENRTLPTESAGNTMERWAVGGAFPYNEMAESPHSTHLNPDFSLLRKKNDNSPFVLAGFFHNSNSKPL